MRIVLDAMGSDDHPEPELQAAVEIAERWPEPLLLVGPQDVLQPRLDAAGLSQDRVRVIHAPEVLKMTDKPARTARGKAKSSMAVGMHLIKDGEADAFVTAGNTGGALANAIFILGRIRGVKRPPLAAMVPVRDGHIIALDIGANADCKPEYLAQFAVLGSVYAETALGKEKPRVGLLSNGEEPGKGNTLVKETFPLLEKADIHFLGNVEPKEAFAGVVDVVVMDGFTGNVFIKASESVSSFLISMIREEIEASPLTMIGGLLARPAFRSIRKMLDPAETGAAPLLGIKGLVFVGHGRSDARALVNAVRVTRQAVEHDLLKALQEAIQTRLAGHETAGEM
jgi:glycerol-3-phosphate acyltransferase PlsX